MPKKYNPRVVMPTQVLRFLELAGRVWEKHDADGPESPLKQLSDVDWDDLHPLIEQAKMLHGEAEALRMAAEQKTAERNLLLKPLMACTRRSAAFLKALHFDNVQHLGEWGFEVNATPKKKKPRKEADEAA